MGKGLSGRKAGATQRGRPHREKPGRTAPRRPQAGQQGQGERGGGLMHRLLGAVHEATVQLRELPIGDVAGALLQVLETERDRRQGPPGRGAATLPARLQPARRPSPSAAPGGSACWGPGS